jgi:hypothetical protein
MKKLIFLLFLLLIPIASALKIDDGGYRWAFEVKQEDTYIGLKINEIGSNIIEIELEPKISLDTNYRWKMGICADTDSFNIDGYSVQKDSFSKYGLSETWCNNQGFVIKNDKSLTSKVTIQIPEELINFEIYSGDGTVVIEASAIADATAWSTTRSVAICGNKRWVCYRDLAQDLDCAWTEDDLNFNKSKASSGSTDYYHIGVLCNSTGSHSSVIAYGDMGTDVDFFQTINNGTTWTLVGTIDEASTAKTPSCKPDSDGVLHCCVISQDQNMFYWNSTEQNWLYLQQSGVDDVDTCDIVVNQNDNKCVIGSGSDQDDIDIWCDIDSWTRREIFDGSSYHQRWNSHITYVDNSIYVGSTIDGVFRFFNSTWDHPSSWTQWHIDASPNYHGSVASNDNHTIFEVTSQGTTVDGTVSFWISTNSTIEINFTETTNESRGYCSVADQQFPSSSKNTNKSYIVCTDISDYDVYYYTWDIPYYLGSSGGAPPVNNAPTDCTIVQPSNGVAYNITDINYTCQDSDGDTLTYYSYVNGVLNYSGSGNNTAFVSADGTYTTVVSAYDGTDWSANSSSVSFTINTTEGNASPSNCQILFPTDESNHTAPIDINYTCDVNDADRLKYYLWINGSLNQSGITGNTTQLNLKDSYYVLRVQADDGNTNSTLSSIINVWINQSPQNTPPHSCNITNPLNNSKLNYTEIEFSCQDNMSATLTYYLWVNGSLNYTGQTNITNWTTSMGYYELKVHADDGMFNSSNSSFIRLEIDNRSSPPSNATSSPSTYSFGGGGGGLASLIPQGDFEDQTDVLSAYGVFILVAILSMIFGKADHKKKSKKGDKK